MDNVLYTFLGVIFGGLIAAVPSLLTVFMENRRQQIQLAHELYMRKLDLIDSPRIAALQEYSRYLGAFFSSQLSEEFTESQFLAAHQKACIYVSDDTRAAMMNALPVILSDWHSGKPMTLEEKEDKSGLRVLNTFLNRELQLSSRDEREYPSNAGHSHNK